MAAKPKILKPLKNLVLRNRRAFSMGKMKTVDFSETIAACDLKLSLLRYVSTEGQGLDLGPRPFMYEN